MEKITVQRIADITGFPVDVISKAGRDGYGTNRPHEFHFGYRELEKHFQIEDRAAAGYSFKYPTEFYTAFSDGMKRLENAGIKVIDPMVLSHYHGYFARKIGWNIKPTRGDSIS